MVHPLLHADADAFFASVVLRDEPALREQPLAVVAHVVVTCPSYPARTAGVRAGMGIDQAKAMCPGLVVREVPYDRVEEAADDLFGLFAEMSDAVEPGSMEEAFLDPGVGDWDGGVAAARHLRARAWSDLRLPVTVGVGRTKLMAKLASRAGKPDGLYVIDEQEEARLRSDLTPAEIWGVGARAAARLSSMGIARLADLDALPPEELRQACGTALSRRLTRIRAGTDDATLKPVRRRASMTASGAVTGYARPDHTPEDLVRLCTRRVCKRAQRVDRAAGALALVLKTRDGQTLTRRRQFVEATSEPDACVDMAMHLLMASHTPPLEWLGITLDHLVDDTAVQGALF